MPYKDRLETLGITTLEKRRKMLDMVQVWKILTGSSALQSDEFFKLQHSNYNLRRHKLTLERAEGVSPAVFWSRVVKTWNSLPASLSEVRSIPELKSLLSSSL